ncbi:hypothetical protein SAMD00019534_044290, partial [Acytostelium subglobosum LB1]|uniref:hypothetical protein n=1 Tax=Acytostelium subglobosum LB1 TaxID=1410327 RepID=UPI000644F8B6
MVLPTTACAFPSSSKSPESHSLVVTQVMRKELLVNSTPTKSKKCVVAPFATHLSARTITHSLSRTPQLYIPK